VTEAFNSYYCREKRKNFWKEERLQMSEVNEGHEAILFFPFSCDITRTYGQQLEMP